LRFKLNEIYKRVMHVYLIITGLVGSGTRELHSTDG
jgi:hypothetical protein